MEKDYTPEMLQKFKETIGAVKSAEEIFALAEKLGVELSAEKAEEMFAKYHKSSELSDEELGKVSGGIARSTTITSDPNTQTVVTHV